MQTYFGNSVQLIRAKTSNFVTKYDLRHYFDLLTMSLKRHEKKATQRGKERPFLTENI